MIWQCKKLTTNNNKDLSYSVYVPLLFENGLAIFQTSFWKVSYWSGFASIVSTFLSRSDVKFVQFAFLKLNLGMEFDSNALITGLAFM